MSPQPASRTRNRGGEEGYLLIGVLILVFMVLLTLSVAAPRVAMQLKREKEIETQHRANQYVRGIRMYYKKFQSYPGSITALESSNNQKFLRQHYIDPMTGKDDWRLIEVGKNKTQVKGFFGEDLPGMGGGLGSAAGMMSSTGGSNNGSSFGSSGASGSASGSSGSSFGSNSGSSFGSNSGSSFGGGSGSSFGSGSGSSFGSGSGSSFGSGSGSSFGSGSSPTGAPGGSQAGTQGASGGTVYPPGTDQTGSAGAGTGTSGTGSTGSGTTGSGSGNNSTSATDFKGGGAPIMGVAIPKTGKAFLTINEKSDYEDWEFLYDPRIEQLYAKGNLLGGGAGLTSSGSGSSNGLGQNGQNGQNGSSGSVFGTPGGTGTSDPSKPANPTTPTTPVTPVDPNNPAPPVPQPQ